MKVFVGLGNPGKQYRNNRHNAGFMFVEYLKNKLDPKSDFKSNSKFDALVAEATKGANKYIILEPRTFMNSSGDAVTKLLHFYKVDVNDLFVAHDDLDIPLGKTKVQYGTGPKLHGGLSSIEQLLGTGNFWRIRLGVENRNQENRLPGEAYVLQDFQHEEKEVLTSTFEKLYSQLLLQKIL